MVGHIHAVGIRVPSVLFLTLAEIAERAAFLTPRAGRGQQAPSENRNSARWGRFRESELVETPAHRAEIGVS